MEFSIICVSHILTDTLDKTEPEIYLNDYTSSWLCLGFGPPQGKRTQLNPIPAYLTA